MQTSDLMYVVVDTESRNLLGEFASLGEAQEMRQRFADSDPKGAAHIEIVPTERDEGDASPEARPADV